jgi:hypothetical protein
MPRMLIIAAHGGPVVVPVDEVDGIHAIDEQIRRRVALRHSGQCQIHSRRVAVRPQPALAG